LLWGFVSGVTVDGVWHLGIGDPTALGWATTAAYFAAFGLCLRTTLRTRRVAPWAPTADFRPLLWLALAALLFLLGVNKQLDLQTWFTQVGKQLALAQGWYARRRAVQACFVAVVGLGGLAGIGAAYWVVRGTLREHLMAVIGMGFLLSFVFIRAASFHHVDRLIRMGFGGVKMNHVFEIGGITCVAVAAWNGGRAAERAATKERR